MVGDGPARAEIEAAFAPLGAAAWCSPAPWRKPSCRPATRAADLCVWPAVREAYGVAMLEAQAAGLPVVAGRECGVAEVVQDGMTGVLTPPRDSGPSRRRSARCSLMPTGGASWPKAAWRFVAEHRSMAHAVEVLDAALRDARAIRAARS